MGIRATQNPLECTPAVLSRFLGEFASLVALQTAHPLPTSGSYAVVNETGSDLIYYWSDADQEYFTPQSGWVASFDGIFHDGTSLADWLIMVDVGDLYFYRSTDSFTSSQQLKFRIDSEGVWFYDDSGDFKYLIKKPVSGNSMLVAPETTGDETIATQDWTNSQGFEKQSNKGAANGYTPLNASSKIDATYLPDSILGQVNYQGTWNASTNSPSIPIASSANKGYYYIVNFAGTTTIDGINDWQIGDWIISNGNTWSKVDNTDAISSFNGRTGAITLVSSDVTSALGFTPENSANKATTMTGNTSSNTLFLSAKAVYDWVTGLLANASTAGIMKLFTSTGTATDGTMTQKAITDALATKANTATLTDISSTATYVGWSSFTTKETYVLDYGSCAVVIFRIDGVSNSATTTVTLPFTNAGGLAINQIRVQNNSTFQSAPGNCQIGNGSSTLTFVLNNTAGAFTASGNKSVWGQITILK